MGITGLPLILLVAFGALAAVAATVLVWNRFGRVRYLLRAAGVLLAEVLLLLSVGLAVNRSEQFYPTWDALLNTKSADESAIKSTNGATYRTGPGALDRELAVRAGGRPGVAQAFPWQSADWRGWGLAGAPTVITPPGYLLHPAWSYSAVIVVGGWPATVDESATRRATAAGISAVVVFATATAATTAPELATALPTQLDRDLRVTTHRWAIVAAAGDATLADNAVVDATVRYPSIAVVPAGARAGVLPAGVLPTGVLPTGVTAAAVVEGNTTAPPSGVLPLPSAAPDALYTALSWAIERTPPPLASPQPSPRRCGCHRTAGR